MGGPGGQLTPALLHVGLRLSMRQSIGGESKSSLLYHFPCSSHESTKGGSCESSTDADPLYPDCSQFCNRKRPSFNPITTLTGLETDAQTSRIASRLESPGAYTTSAPASAKACNRRIVSTRSGRPWRKFSALAASMNAQS